MKQSVARRWAWVSLFLLAFFRPADTGAERSRREVRGGFGAAETGGTRGDQMQRFDQATSLGSQLNARSGLIRDDSIVSYRRG